MRASRWGRASALSQISRLASSRRALYLEGVRTRLQCPFVPGADHILSLHVHFAARVFGRIYGGEPCSDRSLCRVCGVLYRRGVWHCEQVSSEWDALRFVLHFSYSSELSSIEAVNAIMPVHRPRPRGSCFSGLSFGHGRVEGARFCLCSGKCRSAPGHCGA